MSLWTGTILELGDKLAQSVAILDSTGAQLSGFDSSRPANAAHTTVASSATSVTLLASNAARRKFIIVNDSTKILYIAFAATATTAAFAIKLGGGASYESRLNDYTGVISGIWAAVNGNARITEITT